MKRRDSRSRLHLSAMPHRVANGTVSGLTTWIFAMEVRKHFLPTPDDDELKRAEGPPRSLTDRSITDSSSSSSSVPFSLVWLSFVRGSRRVDAAPLACRTLATDNQIFL